MSDTQSYEYISVSWAGTSPSGKTNIYSVTNNRSILELGRIKWYGPWRQYIFTPSERVPTLYSAGCLRDIADFIKSLR